MGEVSEVVAAEVGSPVGDTNFEGCDFRGLPLPPEKEAVN